MRRLVGQRPFGLVPGYEELNDKLRDDISGRARSRSRRSTMAENPAAALLVLDRRGKRPNSSESREAWPRRRAARLLETTGGLRKETEPEAMDPQGGNRRSRARSRTTGFRFAPTGTTKRAGARRGTVSFQDAEGRKRLVLGRKPARRQRNSQVAHVRKVQPRTGCCRRRRTRQLDASRKAPARRTGGRLFSCMRTSRRSFRPSRAIGAKSTVQRDDVDGVDKVALSP